MKTIYISLIISILFSFSVYGKENTPLTDADNANFDYSKVNFSQAEIFAAIDNIYNKMKKESADNPLYPTQFGGFAGTIDFYCKYPKLEKETNISKFWFEKLQKILVKMSPVRVNMKIAKAGHDNKLYEQNFADYLKLFTEFETLYKNPEKIKK
jgi:hypothetical protein